MREYNNPGPIENNVYVPVRGEIGAISASQIGGEGSDPKSLADLDYFKELLYAGLGIPKQFMGDTADSTGFNGGTSLTLISSRYAKKIRAIQSSLIEMVTDIVNLILLNRGMESYINKFEIKMQPPTTQEEKDRKENVSQGIQITRDILDMLQDIQDPATKLEITKILLSANLVNPGLIAILEKEVEKLREGEGTEATDENLDDFGDSEDLGSLGSGGSSSFNEPTGGFEDFETETSGEDTSGEAETEESNVLPNMSDLNMDFTDNTENF